jgi:predicted dehydrogenase
MSNSPATPQAPPLKIAFIGGAVNSAVGYAHFASCSMDRQWQIVAGCFSTHREANHDSARAYGVHPERMYASWQALVDAERGRIDAVAILTPIPAHFDMVAGCMRAGIPVICEKALAADSTQAEALLALREQLGAYLAVTYNYTGYPMLRELASRIRQGRLGKILHFQAEMPQEGFVRLDAKGNKPTPQAWRLHDGAVPTLHLDLGTHLHQIMHYLTGERPQELVADQNSFGWFGDIVDNASCLCRYSGGVQGQFWFSKSALGHRNGLRIRIYGELGSAEWYQLSPEELLLSHQDGRREILDRAGDLAEDTPARYNRFKPGHPAGFIEAFANLYRDLADSLRHYQRHGTWLPGEVFSAELALEGMRFLETMVQSAHSKSWQTVRL